MKHNYALKMEEIMTFANIYMHLEDVRIREIIKAKKHNCNMNSFSCGKKMKSRTNRVWGSCKSLGLGGLVNYWSEYKLSDGQGE